MGYDHDHGSGGGGGPGTWNIYTRVSGKTPISHRKNLPIVCVQGYQLVRCLNRIFCVHQASAVESAGGVLAVAACVSVVTM